MSIAYLLVIILCIVLSIIISVSSSVSSLLYFKVRPAQIDTRTVVIFVMFLITIFVIVTNFITITNYAAYRNERLLLVPVAIATYLMMLYVLIKPLKGSKFANKVILVTTTLFVIIGIIVEISALILT